jgi:hypothetical protein
MGERGPEGRSRQRQGKGRGKTGKKSKMGKGTAASRHNRRCTHQHMAVHESQEMRLHQAQVLCHQGPRVLHDMAALGDVLAPHALFGRPECSVCFRDRMARKRP